MLRRSSILCVAVVLLHVASARDLRTVTEPKTPQTCTVLKPTSGDETTNIQNALDKCAKGKAVELSSGSFSSGPLTIPSGVSLLVNSGATLKAIPNPALYDFGKKTCGTLDNYGVGCKPFITIRGAIGSGIYGKGTIDGQGGHKMTGKNESWWQLAKDAAIMKNFQNIPKMIQVNDSSEITLYQFTLKNGPYYHVYSSNTYGLTIWGITIDTSPSSRNTDGIDPMGSQNITIAHCNITTGDDNVAIKAMDRPTKHVSILNNHFGKGHGMSIGSEIMYGVSDVTVSNLTLDGTLYGLRIKSNRYRGGVVTGVNYTDVCMINVKNPIFMDMNYERRTGKLTPSFQNITFNNIKVLTEGDYTFKGLSDSNPIEVTLKDVHVVKNSKWVASHAKISGTYEEDATGTTCGNAGYQ